MNEIKSFKQRVQNIQRYNFAELALEIFQFQAKHNPIYKDYLTQLGMQADAITSIMEIPFLPIEFFKHHKVKTQNWAEQLVFMSSGTTGQTRSKHYVEDSQFYLELSRANFEREFGSPDKMAIYALLPSYQEQGNSSLIAMVDHLISAARHGGYFLNDRERLEASLRKSLKENQSTMLFGVGYALLDFVAQSEGNLGGLKIIETGGMKGRREEMTKEQFYSELQKLGKVDIYSEYGMTELFSQAYSHDNGFFKCAPQMKVLIRDLHDPFSWMPYNKTGQISVIDLSNAHSCSFLETSDIGRVNELGGFEVLGRKDNSDIRGCNLMVD